MIKSRLTLSWLKLNTKTIGSRLRGVGEKKFCLSIGQKCNANAKTQFSFIAAFPP